MGGELIRVLRSADRTWRVEFVANGRVRIYNHGFLQRIVWRYEVAGALAALGVDAEQLIED